MNLRPLRPERSALPNCATPRKKEAPKKFGAFLAAELGFEPRHTESESAVLPLHNSASRKDYYTQNNENVKCIFKKNQFF